mmetsp:Transcript_15132/g.23762  ORF Transcript_15132/g.23762 Transcript_15132/m.23762 type:complete len:299 (+) Transcript_15132:85-981(+)
MSMFDTREQSAPTSRSGADKEQGEARDYMMIENMNVIPLWLAPCHLVAALFQCMQSLFLFAFSSQVDLRWNIYSNFPAGDELVLGENEYAKPEANLIGSYSVTWYAGVFILLSGIDHISCLLPSFRQKYEWYIERHQSPFRWVEYSFSAALMRALIAQVAGVTDVHLIYAIYVMSCTTLLFAIVHERLNAKARADGYPQDWLPICFGYIPHLASWSIIFCYFFAGVSRGEPPAFVSTIVFSLFLLDFTFPICFFLQWKQIGVFRDYLVGEFGFIMLSFTAKTFLAWVTLAGANGYTRN